MNRNFPTFLTLFAVFFATAAFADPLEDRFSNRLPQVVALKKTLAVGEDNQGYLAPRRSLSGSEKAIMNAENSDRKELYSSIASKVGLDAKVVGMRRAADIRAKAKGGIWVQSPDGEWEKR